MKLTQEEKRIKLAEAAGWEFIKWGKDGLKILHPKQNLDQVISIRLNGRTIDQARLDYVSALPDYFNDLNAVHELEKLLTEPQQAIFADRLNMLHESADLTYLNSNARGYRKALFSEAFHLIHATAAQRAEALGLTLNLWTE